MKANAAGAERRQSIRYVVPAGAVGITVKNGWFTFFAKADSCHIRDISRHGIGVILNQMVEDGQRVTFVVVPEGGKELILPAEPPRYCRFVRGDVTGYAAGFRFSEKRLTSEAREFLEQLGDRYEPELL